jgi:hypothetical protein
MYQAALMRGKHRNMRMYADGITLLHLGVVENSVRRDSGCSFAILQSSRPLLLKIIIYHADRFSRTKYSSMKVINIRWQQNQQIREFCKYIIATVMPRNFQLSCKPTYSVLRHTLTI